MKAILVNFNFTPDWLKKSELDYFIIDQSDSKEYLKDFPQERIEYVKNIGNIDYAKLSWLINNYDELPDVFLWGKTNLFKYISEEEWKEIDKTKFTPLLTKNHKTYSDKFGVVCYYADDGLYYERNDDWYVQQFSHKFDSYRDWCQYMLLPSPNYIPFPPGGNFILTKERVHRYARDFYIKMANTLPHSQLPAEAHFCERTYYSIWK